MKCNLQTHQRVHIIVICVTGHSLKRLLYGNINVSIMGSDRIIVTCVKSLSVPSVVCRYITAIIVGSEHILVICVISRSLGSVFSRDTNAPIAWSDRISVMYAANHSVRSVFCRYINASTVWSDHPLLSVEVVQYREWSEDMSEHPLVVWGHVTEMSRMQFVMHCYVKIYEFFHGVVVPISVIM